MIAEWLMGNDVDVAAIAKATASLLHAVNESDVPAVVAVWSGDGRSCLRITAPFAAARRSRPRRPRRFGAKYGGIMAR